jgi:hypothetical protein
MERKIPLARTAQEVWRNSGDIVRRTSGAPDSPVTPDLVLEGLKPTVQYLGREIGRTTFLGIFPNQENTFDRFFNRNDFPETSLGEVA